MNLSIKIEIGFYIHKLVEDREKAILLIANYNNSCAYSNITP